MKQKIKHKQKYKPSDISYQTNCFQNILLIIDLPKFLSKRCYDSILISDAWLHSPHFLGLK